MGCNDPTSALLETTPLMESFLIEKVHVELPVDIALRYSGERGADGPFHADGLRVTLGHILHISEGKFLGDLLLECKGRLGCVGSAHNLRVDGQFAHSEQPLQSAGDG